MTKKLTQKQINKKYKDKYIEVNKNYCYSTKQWFYEIIRTSKIMKENMTLGQDLGTVLEYTR